MAIARWEQVDGFEFHMSEFPSRKVRFWRKPRYLPLQYRLILSSSGIIALLLAMMAAVVGYQQSRTITEQVERRGLAIAQSLAATSKAALTTYDYIALSRNSNQAVQEPDLAYVIIHDKEGRVAGYSGHPDLEGKFLSDDLSLRAVSTSRPLTQNTYLKETGTPVLDIAVPVAIPGSEKAWGVVRVALSLAPMYRQIRQIQLVMGGIGIVALILSVWGCIWTARRITRPVGVLVDATIAAAKGDLDQNIQIATGDEVEVLAGNFSVMIREILSQRQQLETHLAEITDLQRYLDQLLKTMNDGLLSIDMEGRLATINPAACEILGIEPGALDGRATAADLPEEAPELLGYIRSALDDPYQARQQELRVGSGQEAKNIIVASSVLAGKDDVRQQIIINLHDVTALKKLEVQFRQAERLAALGTLSAGMAHEIRNPLSAIKTFVQLLPRKIGNPDFLEKFHRTVPRELARINRLIEDLLELARTPKYYFELASIRPLLEQTVELFEPELLSHCIQCRLEIAGELPPIWVSVDQLAKAFNNLIRNAIQAMPGGGDLRIRACRLAEEAGSCGQEPPGGRDSRLRLIFSDTGVGMEPEDMKSIFNPFFTTKDSGTGLGLAITHKVITEHGGQIEVDSAPGKGTRFTVYLPVQGPRRGGQPPSLATV